MKPTCPKPTRDADPRQMEREALRIQASALAAQQVALTEEEGKLDQRHHALLQQEGQLASHLEEKRRHLVEVRDEARSARTQLNAERAELELRVAESERDISAGRAEVADGLRLVQTERRRLFVLRRKLKHRLHRQALALAARTRLRERELAEQKRLLEAETDQIRSEKADLVDARRHYNGEMELGRRQLKESWDEVQKARQIAEEELTVERNTVSQQALDLDARRRRLIEAEQIFGKNKGQTETALLRLRQECEGLETRIQNQRRKLAGLEKESAGRELLPPNRLDGQPASISPARLQVPNLHALTHGEIVAEPNASALAPLQGRLFHHPSALAAVADQLADQRARLGEQSARLVQAQQQWQVDRDAAVAELETLGLRLREREQELDQREQVLTAALASLRRAQDETDQRSREVEAWRARVSMQQSAWEGDRKWMLADVQLREQLAAKQLQVVAELRRRWQERRCKEVGRLRTELASCSKLRKECADLREDWLARRAALDQKQRTLVERALVMEQFWQDCNGKGYTPEESARRLEKLKARWAGLSDAAERLLERERQVIREEALLLEKRFAGLQKVTHDVALNEADLSRREAIWEHEQGLVEAELLKLRGDLRSQTVRNEVAERQLGERTQEVERLARLLLDDNSPPALPYSQAA